jgi:hypothetical protein
MDDVIQRVRRALPLAKWIDYDQILSIYNRGDGIPRALTTESVDAWE